MEETQAQRGLLLCPPNSLAVNTELVLQTTGDGAVSGFALQQAGEQFTASRRAT